MTSITRNQWTALLGPNDDYVSMLRDFSTLITIEMFKFKIPPPPPSSEKLPLWIETDLVMTDYKPYVDKNNKFNILADL